MRPTHAWLRLSFSGRRLSILLLAACLLGCGTAAASSSNTADRRAREVWQQHEAVARLAVKGKRHDPEKFVEACLFFEQVTSISIHVNMFTFGFIPEREAPQDLKLIRAWYKKNHTRLYWDEVTKTVKVRALPS